LRHRRVHRLASPLPSRRVAVPTRLVCRPRPRFPIALCRTGQPSVRHRRRRSGL
jgi:hypothetical protein